jgi:hypothetical protein
MSSGLWQAVNDLIPNSLQYVIGIMVAARVLTGILFVTHISRSDRAENVHMSDGPP